jgi:mevalonyl-CoA ligase
MVAGVQASIALTRLQQTQQHILPDRATHEAERQAIVHGPTTPELWELTLSELLDLQCREYRDCECLVVPWTNTRWTYGQLQAESEKLARGLIAGGIQHGDRIGVMAGNCEQYVSLFFAAAAVGAILVVINNTYTRAELMYALEHTGELPYSTRTFLVFFFFFGIWNVTSDQSY